jgi:hypothetical protein
MPKIEVDEAEYNQMAALRGIASKIVGKPEARKLLEQAHKMVDPNASTPTLDDEANSPVKAMEKSFNERIAAMEKARDDEKREQTLAAIAERQATGIAKLRRSGYTDEGVAAVQKLMDTKGLLDVDDAVAIFERTNPPAMPVTPGGGLTGDRWNFADNNEADKNIQALLAGKGDSQSADAAAMRMAQQTLAEMRGGR